MKNLETPRRVGRYRPLSQRPITYIYILIFLADKKNRKVLTGGPGSKSINLSYVID